MKLAFSSNAYLHFTIEETISKIAELGYTGIEILADVPHAWPAGLLEERNKGASSVVITPVGSGVPDDPEVQSVRYLRERNTELSDPSSRMKVPLA